MAIQMLLGVCRIGNYICVVMLLLTLIRNHVYSEDFECNFDEPDLCGFTQDTNDDLQFLHQSGLTPTEGTGPPGDHTSGFGHYMYFQASGATFGSNARIISPRFVGGTSDDDEYDGVKITFWASKNGEEMGDLRLFKMDAPSGTETVTSTSSTMQQILEVPGVLGTQWVKKNVTIPKPAGDFYIVFEATCGASSASDIAIDDVTVNDDIIPGPTPLETFNCTFEEPDTCVFTQDDTDDFNLWKYVASNNLNPHAMRKDHTTGDDTGSYMSVDAYNHRLDWYWWGWRRTSADQSAGQVARLISPMITKVNEGEDPACLLFFYHMHGGDGVGQIRVFIKNETSEDLGGLEWFLGGERGSVWRAAEVRIDQPLDFQIIFQITAGNLENIAIDDISLSRYECPGEHPVALVPSVDCDFGEAEICYYTHDPTANFNWIWTNRATDSSFTGPAQDHTRGDELGFYVHISSSGQRPESKARLISPLVNPQTSSSCLEFWYHMYGSHIGQLNVYLKNHDGTLPNKPVWSLSGNQGNVWHRASFVINRMTQDFHVVFEGVLGRFYRTDIAIDDVAFYPNSPCPYYPTQEPIPTTIPSGLLFNMSCTFEEDSCNFTQATDDILDWQRVRASYLQQELNGWRYTNMLSRRFPKWNRLKGPATDHTTESHDGWFMAFWYRWSWYSPRLARNDQSRIISPLMSGSDQPRCLTFYIFKDGYTTDFMNVYFQYYGETREIDPDWAYFWPSYKYWMRKMVDIPPSDRPFNIIFEAVVPGPNSRWRQYMMFIIDDVKVESGVCPRLNRNPASCDFEEDTCNYWGHWTRISGETPSRHTGPPSDHTIGNSSGHYMYFETSQPVRPRSVGYLISPRMHWYGKQCVRFYYHASGNDTRRMEVYLREQAQWSNQGQQLTQLKLIEGKQKDAWVPVNADIEISGDFNIIFKAYAGRGYQSDIAVDDIIILNHPCVDLVTETSCDFELGPDNCGFTNSAKNEISWDWYDAIYGKGFPLLSKSVATNSFMYLSLYNSSSSKRQINELYSGHLTVSPTTRDLCISVEYLIEGTSDQTIAVIVEEKDGTRRQAGSVSNKNMTEWKMYTASLLQSHSLKPYIVYKVVISVESSDNAALIAVDNFVVSSATCASLGSTSGSASRRSNRSGMAAGLTFLILLIVAALAVLAFIYRSRIQSLVHRCSQSVTEMNYKRSDVAFVNEDKKESVEISATGNQESPTAPESTIEDDKKTQIN
ncbi:MAM and LDL-receptor class A domain-containing protein 1-like [Lytechinus pictus]|uniref:MAM and LDL-receptor class A domain-containing protein 1-like n=1 Tax=Lytechinus pictus TaxID=7653 RepID=UPI0030B9E1AE